MTKPPRTWLPMLALCVWTGGMLRAGEGPHKKKEEPKPAPHKTESSKPEAKKEEPKPAPVHPPAARPSAVRSTPARAASMRRPPVRRPALTHRTTAPVTVTASPEPSTTPSPSTAVIHLVTHSADSPSASGFSVPAEVSKLIDPRDRTERERMELARLERERMATEQALTERERVLSAREAALHKPESAPAPAPVVRKRADKNALTNEGLVKLADAGYDEVFLMELIRRRPSKFDTTVEGLSYLAQAGLTQQLVRTVLAVDEWERARKAEELAGAASPPAPLAGGPAPTPPAMAIPAGMKEVRQKVMVPQGQLRAGERGVMMLEPSGERWYWVPDGAANR